MRATVALTLALAAVPVLSVPIVHGSNKPLPPIPHAQEPTEPVEPKENHGSGIGGAVVTAVGSLIPPIINTGFDQSNVNNQIRASASILSEELAPATAARTVTVAAPAASSAAARRMRRSPKIPKLPKFNPSVIPNIIEPAGQIIPAVINGVNQQQVTNQQVNAQGSQVSEQLAAQTAVPSTVFVTASAAATASSRRGFGSVLGHVIGDAEPIIEEGFEDFFGGNSDSAEAAPQDNAAAPLAASIVAPGTPNLEAKRFLNLGPGILIPPSRSSVLSALPTTHHLNLGPGILEPF